MRIRPDKETYYALLRTCASGRRADAARASRLCTEMIASGLDPSLDLLNALMDTSAEAGDVARARVTMGLMTHYGFEGDRKTYNTLAKESIVSYCIVLYCILYCTVSYRIALYCIVLYCIAYCIVLYCIVSYRIVLYCIVLWKV